MNDPERVIPINMTPTEFGIAQNILGMIQQLCQQAQAITPDQLEIAGRLLTEMEGKGFVSGRATDIIEINRRLHRTFSTWRMEIQEMMPALRWLAQQRNFTPLDILTMDDFDSEGRLGNDTAGH